MSGLPTGSADIKAYVESLLKAGPKGSKSKDLVPYQILSGSGNAHFLSPQSRKFVRVPRGTEIYVLPMEPDSQGRYHVIDLNGRYFMVPGDEIIDLGFN